MLKAGIPEFSSEGDEINNILVNSSREVLYTLEQHMTRQPALVFNQLIKLFIDLLNILTPVLYECEELLASLKEEEEKEAEVL